MLSYGDVRLDLATQRAERAGKRIELTAKEQALLVLFLRHPGQVLTRTRIYDHVWDERYDGLSNTLEVHIMELRRKLEKHGRVDPHASRPRLSVWRIGQRMTLTTRLTSFFLGVLACVLVGFALGFMPWRVTICTTRPPGGWIPRSTRWLPRPTSMRKVSNGSRRAAR